MRRVIAAFTTTIAVLTSTAMVIHADAVTPKATVTLRTLAIQPSPLTLTYGSRYALRAIATYSNGSSQTVTSAAQWSTATPTIATVGAAGIVSTTNTARSGKVIISATYGGKTAETTINVSTAKYLGLRATPTHNTIYVGGHYTLGVYGTFTNVNQLLNYSASYKVSKPGIINVQDGAIVGLKPGTTTLTVTFRGKTQSVTVRVIGRSDNTNTSTGGSGGGTPTGGAGNTAPDNSGHTSTGKPSASDGPVFTPAKTPTKVSPGPKSIPSSSSTPTPPAPAPAFTFSKTAGPVTDTDANGVDAGDTITYTFSLRNSGNVTLRNIGGSDPKLGPLSCSPATLAPGATATCQPVTYVITQADINAGKVASTTTITGTDPSGASVTASSDTSTTVKAAVNAPALSFTKTAGAITDTDANGIDAGDTIRYTFNLSNAGNVTLTNVGITDPKLGPISCSPTTLAPGASTICAPVTYTITQTDMDAGSVSSTATANGTPPTGANVTKTSSSTTSLSSTTKLTVTVSPKAVADADNDSLLDMGDTQPYAYVVTNTGTSSLSNVAVQSSSSGAVTCPGTTLAPGASMTCTSSQVVTLAEVGNGTLVNTATATASANSGTVTSPNSSDTRTFDRMNIALQHGLPNIVSYAELVAKAQALKSSHSNLASTLLPNTPMNWNPGGPWSKSVSNVAAPYQQVILRSNHNYNGGNSVANLAVAGTAPGQNTRLAFVASDIFANVAGSSSSNPETPMADPGTNEFNINLLTWLLNTSNLSTSTAHVALVNVFGTKTTRSEAATRSWFSSHAPSLALNATECDLPSTNCLNGADLIIFGGIGSTANAPAIADQIKAAYDSGVPVLVMNDWWDEVAPDAIMAKFGSTLDDSPTYWDHNGLKNSTRATQLPSGLDQFQQIVNALIDTTFGTPLATSDYSACLNNAEVLGTCTLGTAAFNTYRAAISGWRSMLSGANTSNISWFDQPRQSDQDLMRALVMLADKLRTGVAPSVRPNDAVPTLAYPVPVASDGGAATRALFADATTMSAWSGNQAAADTGTLYCSRNNIVAVPRTCTAPTWPGFGHHSLTLKATLNDEWQATGFDAKPGVPFTVNLASDPGVKVYVRSFFQRNGTTKSAKTDSASRSDYDRPEYPTTGWVQVTTTPTTITYPYGGPLYVRIVGSSSTSGTSVPLQFNNTATHPTVLDMTDNAQVSNFVATIDNGAYYADLGGAGFEAHMPITAIKDALSDSGTSGRTWNYTTHGGLQQFLNDFRDQYVFTIYKMAGLQLGPNTPLASSNDPDVMTACQSLGFPCGNPALNQRTIIQHINYDIHSLCGNLCSGNPIDSDGNPYPAGWGQNHELGHNLQRKQLNVMWADTGANGSNAAAANVWSNYANRSGEVSNNIFPYHTAWNFYRNVHPGWGLTPETSPDQGPLSNGVTSVDAYSIAQSIRLQQNSGGVLKAYDSSCKTHNTTDTTATPINIAIANAIWRNSGTYDDGDLRLPFYIKIALMMRGQTLADSNKTVLHDGWGIWTLLYQAARGWSDATSNQAKWTAAAQATYGMTDFAWTNDAVYGSGNNVGSMIGNDFLLIQLSKITGYDWRPYFQMHGVLYTALANQQVIDNTPSGGYKSWNMTFPALGGQYPFADNSNISPAPMANPTHAWPGAYENSITTKSKVNFTPATCP